MSTGDVNNGQTIYRKWWLSEHRRDRHGHDDVDRTRRRGHLEGLLNGESGIRVLDDDFVAQYDLPVKIGGHLKVRDFDKDMTKIELRRLSYVQRLAAILGRQVWEDAGAPEDIDLERLTVSVGTGLGGGEKLVEAYDEMRARGTKAVSPLTVQMFMPNGPAAVIGLERKARGGVITPSRRVPPVTRA